MKVAARARVPRRRDESRHGEVSLPAVVTAALAAPGEPLGAAVRAEMEQRLGHDFADVRVHADARAAAAAQALDSVAFTSGAHIVFAAGHFRPDGENGRRLLAHELVHTLQQGRGAAADSLQVSAPAVPAADPLEAEAAAVSERVAAGKTVPAGAISLAAPAARGKIARQAREAVARAPLEVPESPDAVRAVADEVARLLAFDPEDAFGRVRRRLARLAPATREAAAGAVRGRIPDAAAARLATILAELRPEGAAPPELSLPDERATEQRIPEEPEGPAQEDIAVAPEADPEASDASQRAAESRVEATSVPEPEPDEVVEVSVPELETETAPPPDAAPVQPDVGETTPGGTAPSPQEATGQEAPEAGEAEADTAPADAVESEALDSLEENEEEAEGAADPAAAAAIPGERASGGEPMPASTPEQTADELDALDAQTPAGGDGVVDEPPGEVPAEAEPEGDEEAGEHEEFVEEMPSADADEDREGAEDSGGGETAEAPAADSAPEVEAGDGQDLATLDAPDVAEGEEAADTEDAAPAGAAGATGEPIEDAPEPDVPDLSEADPIEAMEAASTLPPERAQAAIAGVGAAASRSVGAQQLQLSEDPPQLERPSGAPTAAERSAEESAAPAPSAVAARVERAPAAAAPAPVVAAPLPAAPASPTATVRPFVSPGGPAGELTRDDAAALRSSLRALPTTDPALYLKGGPTPPVPLDGAADPERVHEQRARVDEAAQAAEGDGRRDVTAPMGEAQLYPDVPPETLRASIPIAGRAAAATPAGPSRVSGVTPGRPPAAGDSAASIIASEQRGGELRAAARDAKAAMLVERGKQQSTAAGERERASREVADAVRDSAAKQLGARRHARGDVHARRLEWAEGQRVLVERKNTDVEKATGDAATEVERTRTTAEKAATDHIADGDRKAETARREGEATAHAERARGERETESASFLGWVAKQATDFFDSIKKGIQAAFEAARAAVREAVEKAKELAAAAIDAARAAIVDAIRAAGDLLVAIGDKLLAGFPQLRDRFRQAIKDRVDNAVAAVNRLAEGLKGAVQFLLDVYGAALDAALGLLEKGLLLAVDVYAKAVEGALKFADGVVRAFGVFAALIRDIARDPLKWLKYLARAAKDGVKNHLWKAFKKALKTWFNQKLEEVLGLGLAVWNIIKQGGIPLAKIGRMAWEGLKVVIPTTLIQILIEKLVALIIPAAGAIMTIIEGLQAAWGTVQRVLEAFERFFIFLKAVKTGRAGPQFANAVAAAAIVVIDFVANWLLKRLRKPAGALAKKIKALAKKIGAKLGKLGKRLGKAFKRKRGGKPKKKRASADKRAKAERRVGKATEFLERQLARGMPFLVLRAQMVYARGFYRVRIRLQDRTSGATIIVEANPTRKIGVTKESDLKKGEKVNAYRRRAERALGYVLKFRDVHHVLPKDTDLAIWWKALGIDYHATKMTLELPLFVHQQGVHTGTYAGLRPDSAEADHRKALASKNLDWNQHWSSWWFLQTSSGLIAGRDPRWLKTPAGEKMRPKLYRAIQAEITRMLRIYSKRAGIDLNQFRLDTGKGGAPYRKKWGKPLDSLIKKLNKQKRKAHLKRQDVSDWMKQRLKPTAPKLGRISSRPMVIYLLKKKRN